MGVGSVPLDLHKGARPDERFHLQRGQPTVKRHFDWTWLRRTSWKDIRLVDGTTAKWISWWFFNHLQIYHGTAKCDGTRSRMYWLGQLGNPPGGTEYYVMTTTPSEMWAFRWRTNSPGPPVWDDMGGS